MLELLTLGAFPSVPEIATTLDVISTRFGMARLKRYSRPGVTDSFEVAGVSEAAKTGRKSEIPVR